MKKRITDRELSRAAAELREHRLKEYGSGESGSGPEFEDMLCEAESRSRRRKRGQRILRYAAAAALVLLGSFGGILAGDAQVRAGVINWLSEIYKNSIVYRYAGPEANESRLPELELGWLPEGYEPVDKYEAEGMWILILENEDAGEIAYLGYCWYGEPKHSEIYFDTNYEKHVQTEINGMQIDIYLSESEEANGAVWIDEENGIMYTIQAHMSELEILHIIKYVNLLK